MSDTKFPSLQNVPLPNDQKINILNKDKARPRIKLEEKTIVTENGPQTPPDIPATSTVVIKQFVLDQTNKQHSHIWVYALNNGPYSLHYQNANDMKIITGKKAFRDLLNDRSLNQFRCPDAVAVPIDEINNLNIISTRGPSITRNDKDFATVAKSYLDEFTIFAFAYGDDRHIKTPPATITLQQNDRYVQPPVGTDSKSRMDTRTYLWLPNSDGYVYLPAFAAEAPLNSFCQIEASQSPYKICYARKNFFGNKVNEEFVTAISVGAGNTNIKPDTTWVDGLYVMPTLSGINQSNLSKCHFTVHNSYYYEGGFGTYKIDPNLPYLKTEVTIHQGLAPEIDVFDLVVNARTFQIPREAIELIDHHDKAPHNIVAFYQTPAAVTVTPAGRAPQTIVHSQFASVTMDNRILASKTYDFSFDQLHQLVWTFDNPDDSKERHPEIRLSLSYAPVTAQSIRTMRIIYNDAPEMTGGMVENFKDITRSTTDKNGDRILGFEIKLADETLAGKLVVDFDPQYLPPPKALPLTKEGIFYSPEDSFGLQMNLKWTGSEARPADLNFVRVTARAWDQYNAWSEPKTYHLLIR